MGQSYGPKLVTDSLILCLDARDANSYAGEPTTNVLQYPESIGSGPTQESWSGTITANAVTAPDGTDTATKIEATSGHVYERLYIDTSYNSVQFTTGDTITYSVWIRTLDGTTTTSKGPHIWNYNSPTYGIVGQDLSGISPEWKLLKVTHTVAAHQTNFAFAYSSSVSNGLTGLTYAIWHPQLEVKSYNTPYVKVSRSATNGWADLSGNGNHGTLTNMTGTGASHYKDGQVIKPLANSYLDFDGSNDYVATSFGSGRNPYSSPTTFVAWVKSDTATANKMWLDHGSNGSNQRLYCALITGDNPNIFGIQSQAWGYSSSADTSKWYHQALVMDSGTARGYYDGIPAGTKSYSSYTLPGNTRAGGRASYIWDGQIACFAVYDKALSAAEVKKNFNAQRRRFGV